VKRPELTGAQAAWPQFWLHSELNGGHTIGELVEFRTAVEEVFGQTGEIRPPADPPFVSPIPERGIWGRLLGR
jgi:hypothetical protein